MFAPVALTLVLASCTLATASPTTPPKTVTVPNTHPAIFYHGRWDTAPQTWWAGSGFKLSATNLESLTLHLGPNTTSPSVAAGVSIDYAPFVNYNLTAGSANALNLTARKVKGPGAQTVVRVNVQGWQNNHLHLTALELNAGARLWPYKPAKRHFYFVGDSLSAGQFLPQGVDQAWPFLVGEHFKAEHTVIAQPGATLTDMVSYGNVHGVSYMFWKTEDTGYVWDSGHNYTTDWNFRRDVPTPTHLVIHIGANDASWNVPEANFTRTYLDFVGRMRKMWPTQPLFVFTPVRILPRQPLCSFRPD